MDQITGLPAHPLLVHIPVAMLPLAAIGVVVLLVRRAWYERYRWAVLAIAGIGTIGTFLATASGESLESQLRREEGAAAMRGIHEHADAGELARTLAVVFFIVLALHVVLPWWLDRRNPGTADDAAATRGGPSWLRPVLMVAVAIAAIASTASVVNAGHSGASQTWEELGASTGSFDG